MTCQRLYLLIPSHWVIGGIRVSTHVFWRDTNIQFITIIILPFSQTDGILKGANNKGKNQLKFSDGFVIKQKKL